MRKNRLFLIIFCLFGLSCERTKQETSKLVFRLTPSSSTDEKMSDLRPAAFSPALTINSLAEVNCYAVFVGGPEDFMRSSFCKDSTTATEKMRFHPYAGLIPAGSEVSLEVPTGPDRNIFLVGMKAQGAACATIKGGQKPDEANLSAMHIIGRKTMSLTPGTNTVDISTSFSATDKFDDCHFADGSGGGGNGGIPTQIMITKDFFPRQGFITNSCQAFYVGTFDNSGRPAINNQNMEINISNGTTNYTMYDNCSCSGGSSFITLAPGIQNKCVSYTSQSTPGNYTFKVEPVSVPSGITANFQRQFAVKNTSDNLFDFSGPRRILPNVCYRYQFQYYYWGGNFATGTNGTLNSPTLADYYTSDATCMTNSATLSGSTVTVSGSPLSKADVWFKATTIGPRVLGMFYGSATPIEVGVSVENLGDQSIFRAEFWSDNNIIPVSTCSARPLRVVLTNSYGIAVPAPVGGTTLTINKTVGPGAVNIYPDGDGNCAAASTNTFTIPAGSSHADLYYRVPAVSGSYTLTLTVNGANTNFSFTAP
ncbi:MAG: hypothetical protein AABY64_03130 [Bdellovibrionota bacterium]